MGAVNLMLIGAALIVNGLSILGRISNKGAAPINIIVGSMYLIVPAVAIMSAPDDPYVLMAQAGVFLFGVTYLWLGLNKQTGAKNEGLGWFCGYCAALMAIFGSFYGIAQGDWTSFVMWLAWSALFSLFFTSIVFGKGTSGYIGMNCIIQGLTTTTIPALLMIFGAFDGWVASPLTMSIAVTATFAFSYGIGKKLLAAQPVVDQPVPVELVSPLSLADITDTHTTAA